jgi:hypothetical protein
MRHGVFAGDVPCYIFAVMSESATGPWRVATNFESTSLGSIHHDDQARRHGFSRGLVGGNVHLVHVTAALVERFGPAWYERGFLLFKWAQPVYDGEEVRVVLADRAPGPCDQLMVELGLIKRDGVAACTGVAGLARSAAAAILPWVRADTPPSPSGGDYDPLPEPIGHAYESPIVTFDQAAVEQVQCGGDPHPWYRDSSPWGGPIVPTAAQLVLSPYGMKWAPEPIATEMRSAMNATIQILQTGPMWQGTPYRRTATLVAKGAGRLAFRTIEFECRTLDGRPAVRYRQTVKWPTTRPAHS